MKARRGFFEGALVALGLSASGDVKAVEKPLPPSAVGWVDTRHTVPLMPHPRGVHYAEANPKELESLTGRTSEGEHVEIKLRPEVKAAWERVRAEFKQTAPPELQKYGCFLVHGWRSYKEQAEVKAKSDREHPQLPGHSLAAPPGASVHHSAYAIDIYLGGFEPMYNWYNGTPEERKNPDYVSPLTRNGFVLTEEAEPWHAVFAGQASEQFAPDGAYVGNQAAVESRQRFSERIEDREKGHPHFLRKNLPPLPSPAPARVASR